MIAVPVDTSSGFRVGAAEPLFDLLPFDIRTEPVTNYDVRADGRFVMVKRSPREDATRRLRVMLQLGAGHAQRAAARVESRHSDQHITLSLPDCRQARPAPRHLPPLSPQGVRAGVRGPEGKQITPHPTLSPWRGEGSP